MVLDNSWLVGCRYAALCLVPQVAVLAREAAVPLVGRHGGAELGRLLGALMLPALLQPHAIIENHAVASSKMSPRFGWRDNREM